MGEWAFCKAYKNVVLISQMPVYYSSSGQYPTSATQQYRPMTSVQYSVQPSPQTSRTTQQAGICLYNLILQLGIWMNFTCAHAILCVN